MQFFIYSIVNILDEMISVIYRLHYSNNPDFVRSVNKYIRFHLSWIAVVAGYDSLIYRYVDRKIDYHYKLVNRIKLTHRHASNLL